MTAAPELIARYDLEERQRTFVTGPGYRLEWDGPVFRMTGPGREAWENAVLYVAPEGLADDALEATVERQSAHFASLGHAFEWKAFAHDAPARLGALLGSRGFRAEGVETVVVFPTSEPFGARPLPDGVSIDVIRDAAGLREVGDLNARVNGNAEHADWLVQSLVDELAAAPDALTVLAARSGGDVVAAGWLRLPEGTTFASLWGGSTLREWRRQGLYTALVARRVDAARRRGFAHVTVDCGPESLPILLRRGFTVLTTLTPWIGRPAGGGAPSQG